MKTPRQRLRRLRARRKTGPNRLAEQTQIAKEEARELDRREGGRKGRLSGARVQVEGLAPTRLTATLVTLTVELIAAAIRGLRQVLAPVLATLRDAVAWIAPPIMRPIGLVFGAAITVLATALDLLQAAGGWITRRLRAVAGAVGTGLEAAVTPTRAVACVAIAAAGLLVASQFAYYHGVAVSAPQYAGEVGTIADAPLTDRERTGSAHLYLVGILAIAAIPLIVLALRGRWRLGRVIGLIGLAGIVVTLAIDLPQGLDAGRAGISYEGSEARLIEGFWAQLSASAALLLCGPLLGRYARQAQGRRDEEEVRSEAGSEGADGGRRKPRWRRPRLRSAGTELEAGT